MAKLGIVELTAAVHAAAGTTKKVEYEDILCVNAQQNIVVICTSEEERATRYSQIKEIAIREKKHEVWAYRTAPHDTVKGVIRGIPISETSDNIDERVVNKRNPLALGAKRIGETTTVIVVFKGAKVPNYVRYGSALLRCSLYRKQVDVCHQCGRVGHRKDVCPTPNERRCRGCGKLNPEEQHPCSPRCKLCGGGHVTGDKACKARYKTPYVVRKRQWERRYASVEESQLPSESDFPVLGSARKPRSHSRNRSNSKGRSPSNGGILRRQSRSPSTSRKGRSPSKDRVSWADAAKSTRKASGNATKKQHTQSKEHEMIEALREENKELRRMIDELKKSLQCLAEARGNDTAPGPSTNTSESLPKGQPMETVDDAQELKEPALKKRITKKRGTKEISSNEARLEDRLSKLEKRMERMFESRMEKMIDSLKLAIAEKSRIDHERFLQIEGATQHTLSYEALSQHQDPRTTAQGGITGTDESWPQKQQ